MHIFLSIFLLLFSASVFSMEDGYSTSTTSSSVDVVDDEVDLSFGDDIPSFDRDYTGGESLSFGKDVPSASSESVVESLSRAAESGSLDRGTPVSDGEGGSSGSSFDYNGYDESTGGDGQESFSGGGSGTPGKEVIPDTPSPFATLINVGKSILPNLSPAVAVAERVYESVKKMSEPVSAGLKEYYSKKVEPHVKAFDETLANVQNYRAENPEPEDKTSEEHREWQREWDRAYFNGARNSYTKQGVPPQDRFFPGGPLEQAVRQADGRYSERAQFDPRFLSDLPGIGANSWSDRISKIKEEFGRIDWDKLDYKDLKSNGAIVGMNRPEDQLALELSYLDAKFRAGEIDLYVPGSGRQPPPMEKEFMTPALEMALENTIIVEDINPNHLGLYGDTMHEIRKNFDKMHATAWSNPAFTPIAPGGMIVMPQMEQKYDATDYGKVFVHELSHAADSVVLQEVTRELENPDLSSSERARLEEVQRIMAAANSGTMSTFEVGEVGVSQYHRKLTEAVAWTQPGADGIEALADSLSNKLSGSHGRDFLDMDTLEPNEARRVAEIITRSPAVAEIREVRNGYAQSKGYTGNGRDPSNFTNFDSEHPGVDVMEVVHEH